MRLTAREEAALRRLGLPLRLVASRRDAETFLEGLTPRLFSDLVVVLMTIAQARRLGRIGTLRLLYAYRHLRYGAFQGVSFTSDEGAALFDAYQEGPLRELVAAVRAGRRSPEELDMTDGFNAMIRQLRFTHGLIPQRHKRLRVDIVSPIERGRIAAPPDGWPPPPDPGQRYSYVFTLDVGDEVFERCWLAEPGPMSGPPPNIVMRAPSDLVSRIYATDASNPLLFLARLIHRMGQMAAQGFREGPLRIDWWNVFSPSAARRAKALRRR